MAVFLPIFMYGLWSSVFTFAKVALVHCPPIFFTAGRMLVAGVILLAIIVGIKRSDLKNIRPYLFGLFILGFFSVYLSNICEYYGLKTLTAGKTCFIYSLSPFLSCILSYFHFKEKITLSKLAGLVIGFIGMAPVFMKGLNGTFFFECSLADISVMGAALFSVYGWVLMRVFVKESPLSPLTVNAISMLFGGVLALIHSFAIESWTPYPFSVEHALPTLKGILIITLISNIICYNLYGYMLRRFTATFLSFLGLVSPIFSSLTEWYFLGVVPSLSILFSTALLSIGLWLVYRSELKQGYYIPSSVAG